jgi:integrase
MIYKRGRIFWYEFTIDGRRVRASAKTTNKVAALKAEAEHRLRGPRETQVRTYRFESFVEKFLDWSEAQNKPNTHKRYHVSSKPLCGFFGSMKLDQLRTANIEQFKMKRLKECSPAGVNRDLSALRFVLNFAVRNGYLRESPFKVKLLREGPGMMRIVSYEEERLYLSHANPKLRDIATLILQTGMRPTEVYSIRSENVNLGQGYLFVPEGKTKYARRTIPLTPEVKEVLQRRLRPGYLFPSRKGGHIKSCRSHDDLIKKLHLDVRLYDFRHTFGTRAAMAGVDLPTLKELMGHSTIVLTMRYVHPTPEHKIRAVEKLQHFNEQALYPTISPTVVN